MYKISNLIDKRSIKTSVIFSSITNLSDVFILILMMLSARVLGAKDFGTLSYAQSISIVFLTFANFGLNTIAIRDVARNRHLANRYFCNIIYWKGFLSIIALFLLYLTTEFFIDKNNYVNKVTLLIAVAVMIRFFGMTGRAILQAFQRFDLEAIAVVSEQMVIFCLGVFVLMAGYGLITLAITFLFARALGFIIILYFLKKSVTFQPEFELRFIFDLQIKALPIGIALIVMTAYLNTDTLILSKIQSYHEVGLYNSAFKIYTGLFLIPSIISTVLLPRLSESFIENKKKQNRLLLKGILWLFLISLPLSVCGIYFSREILLLMYGVTFIDATNVLKILFGIITITFQLWLLRIFLVSINMQNALMKLNILGLCSRIIFDMLLIPKYSYLGAAIATGVTELLLFCCMWIFLLKKHFYTNRVHFVTD